MTTAAQYLVALSGLSGVSAGQHLLAITQGTGATIFTTQMTIVSEVQQRTLYNQPKRVAQQAAKAQAPAVSGSKKGSPYSHVVTRAAQQVLVTQPHERWLVDVSKITSTVVTKPNQVFTTRRRAK